MDAVPFAFLAAAVALFIVLVELLTSDYRHTFNWVGKCWQLWVYGLVYAAIAFGLMFLLESLTSEGFVALDGSFVDSPWVQAITIGISTKALMQVTLFNVQTSGVSTMPIGIATITQLFEPWLLERLKLSVWNRVMAFVDPHSQKYTDRDNVLAKISANLPPSWGREKKAAMLAELDQLQTPQNLMYFFVENAGKETFERTFPK